MRTLPRRLTITLVGPGPVGLTLALLLRRAGHRVAAVIGRSSRKTRAAAHALGARLASTSVRRIPPETTLLIIAVRDEKIATVAAEIAECRALPRGRIAAFHCSGIETSDALVALSKAGLATFALHPVQSFPARRPLSEQLSLMQGVSYGYEGPKRRAPIARRIVKDLGGRLLVIPKQKKILYHAACVFASNYPVVLLDIVEDLAHAVSPAIGLEAFRPLTESSIAHAMTLSPVGALTGPVARGSRQSVERHRRALIRHSHTIDEAYRALGLAALAMARRQKRASAADLQQLRKVLRRRR